MASPTWTTPAGSLGTYDELSNIAVTLQATAGSNADYLVYTLLNGNYPTGNFQLQSISNVANLSGVADSVNSDTISEFTIRVTEKSGSTIQGIADRTFTMTIAGSDAPIITTRSGVLSTSSTPAANIEYLTLGSEVTISVADTAQSGLANNSLVYIGGVGGTTQLNNNRYYLGNVTSTTVKLYSDYGPANIVVPTGYGSYVANTGTIGLASADSTYFDTQISHTNPDANTTVVYSLVSGNLPSGLELSATGRIAGYPAPPVSNSSPTTQVSEFTIQASSESGNASANYSIGVTNQQWSWSQANATVFPGRPPVFLNNQPLTLTPSNSDPYYTYYFSGNSLGTFQQDNNMIFKMIGYNFNATESQGNQYGLIYNIYGLNAGNTIATDAFSTIVSPNLAGNTVDGWINGTLTTIGSDINTYDFKVEVSLVSETTGNILSTGNIDLNFVLTGTITAEVIWITDSDLGTITNGQISQLEVKALFETGVTDGKYRIISGGLPSNFELLSNGDIVGRVAFESTSTEQQQNAQIKYTFTVQAYSTEFVEISSTKQFTVTVVQTYTEPYDNLYVQGLLTPGQLADVEELLSYIQTTQAAKIYRLEDSYFGVANKLIYQHMFGVPSKFASVFYDAYNAAIQENHYWKNLTLGPLSTAVAKDSTGKVIYEVVYSKIIDNLVDAKGVSISKQITWPNNIVIDEVSVDRTLYPNSLPNMRLQIEDTIGYINDSSLLPTWMTSQQSSGSVLGYQPCWVLCYTLPDQSTSVLSAINTYLAEADLTLNQINFMMDRFEVDRSLTFTWGATGNNWPQIQAEFISGNTSITTDSLSGLYINQQVKFSPSTVANITSNTNYWINSIESTLTANIIQLRTTKYGNTVVIPGTTANMTILTVPLSASVTNNSQDSYVYFTQETILPDVGL